MSRRDLFVVASTAAISSLLTYLTCATVMTPPEALRDEIGTADKALAAISDNPADETAFVIAGDAESDDATALQRSLSRLETASHSESTAAQDPALAFQKRQELAERFSSLLKNAGNPGSGDLHARIENRFYREELDREWADARENNIRSLFELNENLSGIAPLQVTCRSRNCLVALSASSQDQVRRLSDRFMQAATKSDVGLKNKVIAFFPDVSTGRLVFYLSENGNMDLFQ